MNESWPNTAVPDGHCRELTVRDCDDLQIDSAFAVVDFGGRQALAVAPRTAGYREIAEQRNFRRRPSRRRFSSTRGNCAMPFSCANAERLAGEAVGELRRQTPEFSAAHRLGNAQRLLLRSHWDFGMGCLRPSRLAYFLATLAISLFFLGVVVLRTVQTMSSVAPRCARIGRRRDGSARGSSALFGTGDQLTLEGRDVKWWQSLCGLAGGARMS